jgi:O-antigen/teichoic acid export membrane protein
MLGGAAMTPAVREEQNLAAATDAAYPNPVGDTWRDEVKLIVAGAGWVLPIQLGSSLIGYLTQIAAARWMGVGEYGVYTYAYTWLSFLAISACLGLDTAVLRFIPDYLHQSRWSELRGLIKTTESLPVAVGLGLAVMGSVGMIALPPLVGHSYSGIVVLMLWAVPLQALAQAEIGNCRAIGAPVLAYAPLSLAFSLLFVAGSFVLWRTTGALDSRQAMKVTAISLALVIVGQRRLFHSFLPSQARSVRPSYHRRTWLNMSSVIWFSTMLENFRARSHLVIIGVMRPAAAVGIYNVAQRTAWSVSLIIGAFMAIGAPRLAALYSQGRRQVLQDSLMRLIHWIFWPSVAGALLILWSAGFILSLFSHEFQSARTPTMVLLLVSVIDAAVGPAGWLLELTGHQLAVVRARAASMFLGVLLDVLLIPAYGITGAAIAAIASEAALCVWQYVLTVRRLGLRPSIFDALLAMLRPARR